MDELKLDKALSLLQSLVDELPNGDIEEKYVAIYHGLLTDIQNETGHDLSYFSIPPSEVKPRVTSVDFSTPDGHLRKEGTPTYSTIRYCARARFLIGLKGAINFINSQTQTTRRRIIGFTPPED